MGDPESRPSDNRGVSTALVGHTGFVGQTLLRQTSFNECFNRSNIEEIRGKRYTLIVCAGAPAAKWYANQHPEEDRGNLEWLMSCLSETEAGDFLLISTVDVYPDPVGVDEATTIDPEAGDPYGRHRHSLERFTMETFPRHTIVRLPGLFGVALRKNLIYDFLTTGKSPYTHPDSVFQYYDMEKLWRDLQAITETQLALVNLATEPIPAREIARACSVQSDWATQGRPVRYDMRTRHAQRLGRRGYYLYSAPEILSALQAFVERTRAEI